MEGKTREELISREVAKALRNALESGATSFNYSIDINDDGTANVFTSYSKNIKAKENEDGSNGKSE